MHANNLSKTVSDSHDLSDSHRVFADSHRAEEHAVPQIREPVRRLSHKGRIETAVARVQITHIKLHIYSDN